MDHRWSQFYYSGLTYTVMYSFSVFFVALLKNLAGVVQ